MENLKNKAESSLLYLIMNNARQAKRLLNKALLEQADMPQVSMTLLSVIDFEGNSLVELTRRLKCSKQETSRLVQQAEEQGWINTEASAHDKRSKLVKLSAKGEQLLSEGFDLYNTVEANLLAGLSQQEQKELLKANQLLQQRLKAQL